MMKRPGTGSSTLVVLVLIILSTTPCINAASLRDMPQTLSQPDGTVVACFASGDEYFHWLHDANGYVIVRDGRSGAWVWAAKEDGLLVPTEYVVGQVAPDTVGLEPHLRPDPGFLGTRAARYEAAAPGRAPTTGTMQNIVIFIRFSDEAEFDEFISPYSDAFNDLTPGASSMAAYFDEASYRQLLIESTFYPTPPATSVVSFQDGQPRAYYQPFDATTNPIGYVDGGEATAREHTLLKNAVDAVAAQVPGSLNVDADSDGLVDNVVFIIKGVGDGWGDLLWPHRWSLFSQVTTINGARVWDYNLQLSGWLGVPVLCHEMFHSLGAPDLYRYSTCSSDTSVAPVAGWDLMQAAGDPPQHMLAFMKHRYGGWIDSVPEITTNGTYTLNPLGSDTNNCFKIASPNSSSEYFMVEYRKKEGIFEGSVPGSGLIVYRIDAFQDGSGNACGPPDEVYVYRPGGTLTVNGTPALANLSSDVGRTEINDSSDPSSFLSDGRPGGLILFDVGAADATISFSVSLCATTIDPESSIFPATTGSGLLVVLTAPDCAWTASSTVPWITIDAASTGIGTGEVGYSLTANPGLSARIGRITAGSTSHTVVQQGTGTVLLSQTFEDSADDWNAEGLWHLSSTCRSSSSGHSAPTSFHFGDDASCTYGGYGLATGTLTSPSVNLDTGGAELSFNYLLGTERSLNFDTASVEVWSAASAWTVIDTDLSNGGSMEDNGVAWQYVTYDLGAYAGRTIQIRFGFDSVGDEYNDFPGFYVDDVTVVSVAAPVDIVFADGFESGDFTAWTSSVP